MTVTHDKVFDEPVYNYTREFPFIWEEMTFPIPYRADRKRAEEILLSCVAEHAAAPDRQSKPVQHALEQRYFIDLDDLTPRVFYRVTDDWLELTVRFIVREHRIRNVKDTIARAVLHRFDEASLEIASATYEIAGLPPLRIQQLDASGPSDVNRGPAWPVSRISSGRRVASARSAMDGSGDRQLRIAARPRQDLPIKRGDIMTERFPFSPPPPPRTSWPVWIAIVTILALIVAVGLAL